MLVPRRRELLNVMPSARWQVADASTQEGGADPPLLPDTRSARRRPAGGVRRRGPPADRDGSLGTAHEGPGSPPHGRERRAAGGPAPGGGTDQPRASAPPPTRRTRRPSS